MDISLKSSSVNLSSIQQQAMRVSQVDAENESQTGVANQTAQMQSSYTQVTLSTEARMAQETQRNNAGPQAVASPVEAVAVSPTAATEAVQPTSAAVQATETQSATTSSPAQMAPNVQNTSVERVAETNGISVAEAGRAADAASTANNPAVQLYRDNAERPPSQTGPSAVRVSA